MQTLGQFTRNYTQTTKRGLLTTNKGWVSSTGKVRDIQPVLLSGVSKGAPFGTRLCLQSVVCYTLCRRCCENAVANRDGKSIWSSKKTRLWLCGVEPQAQDWFHQQTGRIWKPPSLVPRRTSGQNVPNHFDKQAHLSTFTLFERTTTTISVDNTGKDLSTVFAPYHVNHNFIRPSVFGLYLIQRASGFFLKQFKTAICHKLLDVFDTRQIIFRCVKFLPFLNIMTVVTYCNSLHNQIFLNFEMGGKPF